MRDSLDDWFKQEILPHEAALLRYLNRVWRRPEDISDLRQEIYTRVYEAARKSRPHNARAFLFSAGRHLLVDRIRRGRIVSIEAVGEIDALNVLVDEVSPERRMSAWEELRRVAHALNRLPPRCREVIWLRKVDQFSTREVAEQLRISERTVEGQFLKGMRLLSEALFAEGSNAPTVEGPREPVAERGHGE